MQRARKRVFPQCWAPVAGAVAVLFTLCVWASDTAAAAAHMPFVSAGRYIAPFVFPSGRASSAAILFICWAMQLCLAHPQRVVVVVCLAECGGAGQRRV